uniref:Bifunctional inhibitor/plant lipid transfer protein/seed storage helical domain-containing protein n=1 Tax=Cucumis sativus TaxID=3659 RepID=A0A0A0LCN4_CUCSA
MTLMEECCDSIEGIKESKPKCLCFFIQQTRNGNQHIKSLGIQEIKLLHLPSVCHLKSSSVSHSLTNFSSHPTFSKSLLHTSFKLSSCARPGTTLPNKHTATTAKTTPDLITFLPLFIFFSFSIAMISKLMNPFGDEQRFSMVGDNCR